MSAHVLVTVERISAGELDAGALVLDCLIYGISSDGDIRNELDGLSDSITIVTDLGTSPLEYYRLIVAETMAMLNPELSIDIKENEIIVLGWDDAKFYGTSAYEDQDDFISKNTVLNRPGKYEWGLLGSGYSGTLYESQSMHASESWYYQPGLVRMVSGSSSGIAMWLSAVFPRKIHPRVIREMEWVANAVHGGSKYFTGRYIGLHGAPSIYSGAGTEPMLGIYYTNNSASGDLYWDLRKRDAVGTDSDINTGVEIESSATNPISFKIRQVNRSWDNANSRWEVTFDCTVKDLHTLYEATWQKTLRVPEPARLWAQLGVHNRQQTNGSAKVLDVDLFRFSLFDMTRVLPEY